MPKKTIVVRKRTQTKVDMSKLEEPQDEIFQDESCPKLDTPAVLPREPEVVVVEDPVSDTLETEAVAAVTSVIVAKKPLVRPRVAKKTKTVKRAPAVVAQPVYEDAVDEDSLSITQQVIDLPETLAGGSDTSPRDRYTGLLNTIYDAVIITSAEGAVREVNARAIEKFGAKPETLCEMNVTEIIAGSDYHLLTVLKENAGRRKFTVLEATCVRIDETRFPAEIVANAFSGDTDGTMCFFIRDVTRRKQAERDSQAMAAKPIRTAAEPLDCLCRMKDLLYRFNDPLQVLLCLAELEKNDEYQTQLMRITEVADQLMKLADGVDARVVEDDTSAADSEPVVALTPCDRSRVLIVDSQDMVARLLAKSVRSARSDLIADTSSNGKHATALFAEHHHAVVVLDLMTPGVDGEEALGSLRDECEQRRWDFPSIMFCSSQDAAPWVRELTGEGAPHAWLRKPFQAAELVKLVTERLD